MSGAIRANEVIRKVQLAECRMRLNGLANGNTASDHCTIVCEIKDEQVFLVAEDFGDF